VEDGTEDEDCTSEVIQQDWKVEVRKALVFHAQTDEHARLIIFMIDFLFSRLGLHRVFKIFQKDVDHNLVVM